MQESECSKGICHTHTHTHWLAFVLMAFVLMAVVSGLPSISGQLAQTPRLHAGQCFAVMKIRS